MSFRSLCHVASIASLLPLLLPLACGGAPPTPAAPAPAETKPIATLPPPDVSAVAAPKDLLAFGRLNNLTQLWKRVGPSSIPMPTDGIMGVVSHAPIGEAVDFSRPIDFAVSLEPKLPLGDPEPAVSMALRPLEEAKPVLEEHFNLMPGPNGVIRLEPKQPKAASKKTRAAHEEAEEEEDTKKKDRGAEECALYPSADTAMRLVCASTPAKLKAVGPYLARTVTRATYPADLHVELIAATYHGMIEGERTNMSLLKDLLDDPKTAEYPAAVTLFKAVYNEAIGLGVDLEKIAIDLELDPSGGAAAFTATFGGKSSRLARIAIAHPEHASTPPKDFWRMPASSNVAMFYRGIDPTELESARTLSVATLHETLTKANVPSADDDAMKNALSRAFSLMGAPMIYASGVDVAKATKAAPKKGAPKAKDEAKDKRDAEKRGRWSIFEIEQPLTNVAGVVQELSSALARPSIAKWHQKELESFPSLALKTTPARETAALPKGTSHVLLTIKEPADDEKDGKRKNEKNEKKSEKKNEKKSATETTKLHLFLVPDGEGHTLVGAGPDPVVVAKMLGTVVKSSDTLANKTPLKDLERAKANAGGFVEVCSQSGGGFAPVWFTTLAQAGNDKSAGSYIASATVSKEAADCVFGNFLTDIFTRMPRHLR